MGIGDGHNWFRIVSNGRVFGNGSVELSNSAIRALVPTVCRLKCEEYHENE
jgi:hypothetical protein